MQNCLFYSISSLVTSADGALDNPLFWAHPKPEGPIRSHVGGEKVKENGKSGSILQVGDRLSVRWWGFRCVVGLFGYW